MVSKRVRLAVLCLSIGVAIAACEEIRPYVYKYKEFDREAEDFNKEPKDRDSVTICYNSLSTTPETAFDMANTECGKYGKHAEAGDRSFGDCPLATPVEAHFACVKP
jgi:hypothetical protein